MNPKTEEALQELMDRSRSPSDRRAAAHRIAVERDEDVVAALAVLVTEIEPALVADVRGALEALGATALLAARLHDPVPESRRVAVELLGYLADTAALPALLGALEDADPTVREQAASALIPLKAEAARASLERHLFHDADPNVRMAAAQALGEVASDAAFEALVGAQAGESDAFVRVIVDLAVARAERIREDRAHSSWRARPNRLA